MIEVSGMKYKLSDIMEIIGGGTPKTSVPTYWNGNIPWLSVKDFNNDYRYVYKTEKLITEDGLKHSTTRLLERNDTIISARGTVGEVAMIPFPMAFNQSCFGLRAKKEIVDPTFLYYLVKYNVNVLKQNSHGSVFDTISRDTFSGITIDVPSMQIQSRISDILSSIDDYIEVNSKINENLLEQAKAIFDEFYNSSDSQQPFTSLIRVLGGGTPKTSVPEYWSGSIPFFTPKDIGMPYTIQTEKYITESGLNHCNSRLYPKNTTFVTARGTVGKIGLAGISMAMNQSCFALMSESLDPILVYFYAHKVVSSLKHKASGAVFDAINTRDFDSESINVLNKDYVQLVSSIIAPMMENIHNNTKANIKLSSLRDSLLPRLMSGDLDVSNLDL